MGDKSPKSIGTASARNYASAYALHYSQRDLLGALKAYDHVIEQHPRSPEADYSRSQMHDIVRSVIPASTLLACDVELARQHLQLAADTTVDDQDSPEPTE